MPTDKSIVQEMPEKRTHNSKTYLLRDGSYQAVIHMGPVHFEDDAGNYHNINTDLFDEADLDDFDLPVTKHGKEAFKAAKELAKSRKQARKLDRDAMDYQGLQVPFECKIPKNIKRGYTIGKGKDKLTFIPQKVSPSKGYVNGHPNEITYQDAWNDADVSLEVLTTGIKETIILKTDRAPSSFSFEVKGDLDDDLTAGELKLMSAWLKDAAGTERDVQQTIRRDGNKTYVDLVADVTALVYPIEIDPTVTILGSTEYNDTYTDVTNPDNTYYNSTVLRYGSNYDIYMKYDLSSIPFGSKIENAVYEITQVYTDDPNSNISGYFYRTTSDIAIADITDNNKPTLLYEGDSANTVTTSSSTTHTLTRWFVTQTLQATIDSGYNYGFGASTGDMSAYRVNYASEDYSTTSEKPKLTVTYNTPPTAPTVIAPNGGETWNSLHTVEWDDGYDVEYFEPFTSNTPISNGPELNQFGQTFTVDDSRQIGEVGLFLGTTNQTVSATMSIKGVDESTGLPNTQTYGSGNITVDTTYKYIGIKISPISVPVGTKLAIVVDNYTSSINAYYLSGDVYIGGVKFRRNDIVDSDSDLQFRVGYYSRQATQYQIQLTTDDRANWHDLIALTNPGVTSIPFDFINEEESSLCRIRARAYDGTSYGPWDQSDGVFTIVHNQAPTAPTNLSPSGIPVDRAADIRFAWQHNDDAGDDQSKFDLQYRLQGSPTWNTITQVTTNNFYDLPGGSLAAGTYEWRVRTYDQQDVSSPYSALTVFIAGDKPAEPTVVSPADGSVVSVANPTIQWSSSGQTGYQVKVLDATGSTTVWDSGQVTSTNKAVTVGAGLENNTDYQIQVLIKNSYNLWSDPVTHNISVSYTPPAVPVVTHEEDHSIGTSTINIENPTPTGTEPSVVSNEIYRREQDESDYIRIAKGVLPDRSFRDYTLAANANYQYFVRAIGDNETYSDSTIESSSVSISDAQIALASDFDVRFDVTFAAEREEGLETDLTINEFAGRTSPMAEFGEHELSELSISCIVTNRDELNMLRNISRRKETLLYRDNTGRKMFCVMGTVSIKDKKPNHFEVSFPISKVYYVEEV